jgi:PmbA protein
MNIMDPHDALHEILLSAKKSGIKSTAAGFKRTNKRMVRFSNDSVTVTNSWISDTPTVCLVSDKRRAACSVEEQSLEGLRRTVEELATTMRLTPAGDVEFSFPKGPFTYQSVAGTFDDKIPQAEGELIDAVEAAVNAARKEGATRSSGVVTTQTRERYLLTSEGAEGADKTTEIAITIRAFVDDDSSGQGIALATNLRNFNPEEAGRTAGRILRIPRA